MKDIHISASQQKCEAKLILGCFALAYLLNIVAIIAYDTAWSELWTQFPWMLILTGVFYAASIGLRIALCAVRKLLKR